MKLSNVGSPTSLRKEQGVYYTRNRISKLLVDSIESKRPTSVLELGVGSGSLVQAASVRWGDAHFLTADICKQPLFELPGVNHKHHSHLNVLDVDLPSSLGIHKDIDVAICNPPYITPKWKAAFSEILEEAGLERCIELEGPATGDLLFLAQNLRLLKDNGHLGIIVPDGLISGERTGELRASLLASHNVCKVIQLPRGIFSGTEAKTHILILENQTGPTKSVDLLTASSAGELSAPRKISLHEAEERLDYSFYDNSLEPSTHQAATLASMSHDLTRGSIGWSQAKQKGLRVFHTTHFKHLNRSRAIHLKMIGNSRFGSYKGILAEKGDILIGRVGRSVPHQIGIVRTGPFPISDCIYRLRLPSKHRARVFSALTSSIGRAQLHAELRGVGAQYLTKKSILNFRLP